MHAYLVAGVDKVSREREVKRLLATNQISPISLITLTTPHTISSIRELRRRLAIAPPKRNRAVIIEEAHNLNIPSQNAFLKTLEEPPKDTIIILSSASEDALLPTIRSRCTTLIARTSPISLTQNLLEEQEKLFDKLSGAGIGERITFAEETGKTREGATAFVEGQLLFIHQQLKDTSGVSGACPERTRRDSPEVERIGKTLLQALSDLRANVNPKMTLFELLKNYYFSP